MRLFFCAVIAASAVMACAQASDYVAPKSSWQKHAPQAEGLDPAKLQAAFDFAIAHGNNIVFTDYRHDVVAVVGRIDDAPKAEFVA